MTTCQQSEAVMTPSARPLRVTRRTTPVARQLPPTASRRRSAERFLVGHVVVPADDTHPGNLSPI